MSRGGGGGEGLGCARDRGSRYGREGVGGMVKEEAYLGVLLVVILLRSDPSGDEVVADAVGEGEVVVPGGGDVAVLDEGVVEVPVEGRLGRLDVLDAGDAADTDLLPLLEIRLEGRHFPRRRRTDGTDEGGRNSTRTSADREMLPRAEVTVVCSATPRAPRVHLPQGRHRACASIPALKLNPADSDEESREWKYIPLHSPRSCFHDFGQSGEPLS